jgi:hypothetical protein
MLHADFQLNWLLCFWEKWGLLGFFLAAELNTEQD